MDFACNNPATVYTNTGPSSKNVNVTITDNCGGSAQVYVVTPSGDVINRTQVNPPVWSVSALRLQTKFTCSPMAEATRSIIVRSTFHFLERSREFVRDN